MSNLCDYKYGECEAAICAPIRLSWKFHQRDSFVFLVLALKEKHLNEKFDFFFFFFFF